MKILIIDNAREEASRLQLALNSVREESGIALCFEITAGETPPDMMMMVPPGAMVTGRDGRAWNNPDPAGIVRFFTERQLKIPIDIEHATHLKAPQGEPAPAMAWGTDLEARPDGSVWAKIQWTPRGTDMVKNKEYSYYSPAYVIDTRTMNIVGIKSVGLTNTPNLNLPALNSEHMKGDTMILAQLLAALGLTATATFDEALNHIGKLKGDLTLALNAAQSPPLDKFVPKADYDLVLNRAATAETELKKVTDTQLDTAINTEIDAALKAGKITPGTKEYHIAQCKQEGGLDRFKTFVAAAPVVADASNLDGKKPLLGTELNSEEKAVIEMMGLDEAAYKKANNLQ